MSDLVLDPDIPWLPYSGRGDAPAGTGRRVVELQRRDLTNPIGFGDELDWGRVIRWRYRDDMRECPCLFEKSCPCCGQDMCRPLGAFDADLPCITCQETSAEAQAEEKP